MGKREEELTKGMVLKSQGVGALSSLFFFEPNYECTECWQDPVTEDFVLKWFLKREKLKTVCPKCGGALECKDRRWVVFRDAPFDNHKITHIVEQPRVRCFQCKSTISFVVRQMMSMSRTCCTPAFARAIRLQKRLGMSPSKIAQLYDLELCLVHRYSEEYQGEEEHSLKDFLVSQKGEAELIALEDPNPDSE